ATARFEDARLAACYRVTSTSVRGAPPRRTPLHAHSRGPLAPLRSRGSLADARSRGSDTSATHLERDRIAEADLESSLRALSQDDAARHARIRMIAHDRDAEAARAKQIRGAIAVDADQIGHDVGFSTLAAIDQQRDLLRRALRGRVLGDHAADGIVR